MLGLLLFGCQTTVTTDEYELPLLFLSDSSIEFGETEWGSTVYRTLYVENRGQLDMGIRKIALQEEGFESNFALSYFPETMTCDTSTESQTETSTSSVSVDTGDQGTEESAEINIGDGFILPGGCRMAVELSYTPLQVGDVYAHFD